MRFYSKKAQSIVEYSVLFAVIIAALVIMQVYIKRGYQGGLKQNADQLGQQYAPASTNSKIVTTTDSTVITYVGGQTDGGVAVPDGVTVSTTTSDTVLDKNETVPMLGAK